MLEFEKVIGPLTEPDDPADAFHVVVPSLPGYGFSDRPTEPGWSVRRIAAAWRELMARLGYGRYGAQGSDWGTSVTTSMGQQDTGQLAGIHVMPPIAAPDPSTFDDLTPAEEAALADLRLAEAEASGYAEQMTTRPQTVGYGLTDSPAGLCAWIVEKFAAWTDSGGRPETVLTRDELLDDITLYWLTRTAASSARLYWESFREVSERFARVTPDTVTVPTGCSIFPKEMPARPGAGRATVTPTSVTGASRTGAVTSPRSSSRACSLTRCAASSAWCADPVQPSSRASASAVPDRQAVSSLGVPHTFPARPIRSAPRRKAWSPQRRLGPGCISYTRSLTGSDPVALAPVLHRLLQAGHSSRSHVCWDESTAAAGNVRPAHARL